MAQLLHLIEDLCIALSLLCYDIELRLSWKNAHGCNELLPFKDKWCCCEGRQRYRGRLREIWGLLSVQQRGVKREYEPQGSSEHEGQFYSPDIHKLRFLERSPLRSPHGTPAKCRSQGHIECLPLATQQFVIKIRILRNILWLGNTVP